jgi:hypothetical protein
MIRLVKKFCTLALPEKRLFLEAFYRLLTARLILLIFPFRIIAQRLGTHMQVTPLETEPLYNQTLLQIRKALRRATKYIPLKSACLVQALAAYRMLKRRNIPSTLYLGVAKNHKDSKKKPLKAHAWLRSGDVILTGQKGVNLSDFTVVSTFASSSSGHRFINNP